MSHSDELTIATANTFWGRMLKAEGGLDPVVGADILLLQEVIDAEKVVGKRLESAGFDLVYYANRFGLVVAVRRASGIAFEFGSGKEELLRPMGVVEKIMAQRAAGRKHVFVERGLIAVRLSTKSGRILTIVNTHPSPPVMPRARSMQIKKIGLILAGHFYDGPLIVGGDMNHYPTPQPIDEKMRKKAGLSRVDLGKQPTWFARGSDEEKYIRIAASLRRRPIESFDGQNDTLLYRGDELRLLKSKVLDVQSDHRAIVATFLLG